MATTTNQSGSSKLFNVPNQLTAARFILALVVFVLISIKSFFGALIVFLLAASTDWIDGYWARRFDQVTQLGRILDPFVDKIVICGTFILLGAEPGSGIAPWMAVVVVGREMLVTGLRSFIEQRGGDFSASFSGKIKMVLQCLAAGMSLFTLLYGPASAPVWLLWALTATVWLAVLSTIQSGLTYLVAAAKFFRD